VVDEGIIMIVQGSPTTTVSSYLLIPFIVGIILLSYYIVRRSFKNRREAIDGPFDSSEEQTQWQLPILRKPKIRVLVAIILVGVVITSVIVVGQQPIHRTDIEHSDPLGDVSDSDIDILQIQSYLNGTDVYLKMTVAGNIIETSNTTPYRYKILIITRGLSYENDTAVHTFTYENGSVEDSMYSILSYVENDTLTIVVPITVLGNVRYMIGLEGRTQTYYDEDLTPLDRDGSVAHLWF
jgi:hypothetical protein